MTDPTKFDENYDDEKFIEQDFSVRFEVEHSTSRKGELFSGGNRKYKLLKLLGKGASGEVWLGLSGDNEIFAIKFLREEATSGNSFVQELLTLSRVEGPNVAEIVDAGLCDLKSESGDDSGYYLVMKYYRQTLGKHLEALNSRGAWSQKQIVDVFLQVAKGLDSLHSYESTGRSTPIIHRDLKPANIFVDDENTILVGDLGLALLCRNDHSIAAQFAGTPRFSAPEQYPEIARSTKHKLTPSADIWSFGVILYEALTESPLFNSNDPVVLMDKIASFDNSTLQLEESKLVGKSPLFDLVKDCLHQNPAKRPNSKGLLATLTEISTEENEPSIRRNIRQILEESAKEEAISKNRNRKVASIAATLAILLLPAFYLSWTLYQKNLDNAQLQFELKANNQKLVQSEAKTKLEFQQKVEAFNQLKVANQQLENSQAKIKLEYEQKVTALQELKAVSGDLEFSNYQLLIKNAQYQISNGNWNAAKATLDQIDSSLNGWDTLWLRSSVPSPRQRVLYRHDGSVTAAVFDRKNDSIITSGLDGKLVESSVGKDVDSRVLIPGKWHHLACRDLLLFERNEAIKGMVCHTDLALTEHGDVLGIGYIPSSDSDKNNGVITLTDRNSERPKTKNLAELDDTPTALIPSCDSDKFIIGCLSGNTYILDVSIGSLKPVVDGGGAEVTSGIACTNSVLVGRSNGALTSIDLSSGSAEEINRMEYGPVWSIATNSNKTQLAFGTNNSSPVVCQWDGERGIAEPRILEMMGDENAPLHCVVFDDARKRLIAGNAQGKQIVWSTKSGKPLLTANDQVKSLATHAIALTPHFLEKKFVYIATHDQGGILTAGFDGTAKYSIPNYQKPALHVHVKNACAGCFAASGYLYLGTKDGDLIVWDTTASKEVCRKNVFGNRIDALLQFGETVLARSGQSISFWNFQHDDLEQAFTKIDWGEPIVDCQVSLASKVIAIYDSTGKITIRSLENLQEDVIIKVSFFEGPQPQIKRCCFDTSGTVLATFGPKDQVQIFKTATGEIQDERNLPMAINEGMLIGRHPSLDREFVFSNSTGGMCMSDKNSNFGASKSAIVSISVSQMSKYVASPRIAVADTDGFITVVDGQRASKMLKLMSPGSESSRNPIRSINFDSNGTRLMAFHRNGSCYVWDAHPGDVSDESIDLRAYPRTEPKLLSFVPSV